MSLPTDTVSVLLRGRNSSRMQVPMPKALRDAIGEVAQNCGVSGAAYVRLVVAASIAERELESS